MQAEVTDADLLAIVKDCERFVLRFFDVIELSASHIYESALPLSPSSSLVRELYRDQVSVDVMFIVIDDVWDACIRTIRAESYVNRVAFSHKDDLIAVGEWHVLEIFEAATGQCRATLTTNDDVRTLAFSPDDNILVTSSRSKADVWDLQTGGLVGSLKRDTDDIESIIFSPCGNMFATRSGDDDTIRIWNTFSLDCRGVLKGHSGHVRTVCWSASGIHVITQSSDTMPAATVWSVSNVYQCSPKLKIHTDGEVESVAFSPDSSLIAAGCGDGTGKVFDAETGDLLHTIPTSHGPIYSIRFFNQARILYTARGVYGIWDITKSVPGDVTAVSTFKYDTVGWSGAMSSDGTRLSYQRNFVKIWQADNLIQNQDMARHHTKAVRCITFSRDGQLVASGSKDKTVKIWDTSTGQCLTTFRGHRGVVRKATFSPNSTLCASWGLDYVIRIWNVRTGNPVSTFEQDRVLCICFSPDGGQLASLSKLYSKLWDVTTGDCLASMEVNRRWIFTDISFDGDGSSIILSGTYNTQKFSLSSAHNPNDFDVFENNLSTPPMIFLPVQDTEPFTLPDASPHQYHLDEENSWVLDNQNRRRLWVPPDSESYFHGPKVVFGSTTGTVTIVDFSKCKNSVKFVLCSCVDAMYPIAQWEISMDDPAKVVAVVVTPTVDMP
jgi:WD40 repeat protein